MGDRHHLTASVAEGHIYCIKGWLTWRSRRNPDVKYTNIKKTVSRSLWKAPLTASKCTDLAEFETPGFFPRAFLKAVSCLSSGLPVPTRTFFRTRACWCASWNEGAQDQITPTEFGGLPWREGAPTQLWENIISSMFVKTEQPDPFELGADRSWRETC